MDWPPLPARSSSTGRPEPAGTPRKSPRGSAPGVFWSAPTRTPRCSRSPPPGSRRSPGCGLSVRTSRTSTRCERPRGGGRSTARCWTWGSLPSSSTTRRAASRSGWRVPSTCGGTRTAGGPTAAEILRDTREKDLADLFFQFGEERFSRRIARAVVERRKRDPIRTTTGLAELVSSAIPRRAWPRDIHPATRVFQALRIAVNRELSSLGAFLDAIPGQLSPGGRVAVISFHSLEDRMVKTAFRRPVFRSGRGRADA